MNKYPANTYPCRATKVYDGDTVTVYADCGFRVRVEIEVRLLGDWAPELRAAGGPEATAFVRDWVARRQPLIAGDWPLTVTCDGHRSFARWLGRIAGPDGEDLSAAIVAAGFASATRPIPQGTP